MKTCYLYSACFAASMCLILVLSTTEFKDETLTSESLTVVKNFSKRSTVATDKKQEKRFLWNLLNGKKYRPTKIIVPVRFPPPPAPPRHRMTPHRHPPPPRGAHPPPRIIQRPMTGLSGPGSARDPPRDLPRDAPRDASREDLPRDSHPHDDEFDTRRISNFWENFQNEPHGTGDGDAEENFGFGAQHTVKEIEYTTEHHPESPGYPDGLENIRNFIHNMYPKDEDGKQELSTSYSDNPNETPLHTATPPPAGSPGNEGRQVKAFWGPPIPSAPSAAPLPPPPPPPHAKSAAPIPTPTPHSASLNPLVPVAPPQQPSPRDYNGGYSTAGSPPHYAGSSHQSYAPSKSYLLDFTPLFLALVPICLALGAAAAFALAGLHGSSSGSTVITGPAAQQQQQQQQQAAAAAASSSSAAAAAAAPSFPYFNFPFFNSPFVYPIFIVNGTAVGRGHRGRRARRGKKFRRIPDRL